jgi:cell division protein YceG involved in septum cleavage
MNLILILFILLSILFIILYLKYKQYTNPKEKDSKIVFNIALNAMNENQLLSLYESSKGKQKEIVLKHLCRIDIKYKEKLK